MLHDITQNETTLGLVTQFETIMLLPFIIPAILVAVWFLETAIGFPPRKDAKAETS